MVMIMAKTGSVPCHYFQRLLRNTSTATATMADATAHERHESTLSHASQHELREASEAVDDFEAAVDEDVRNAEEHTAATSPSQAATTPTPGAPPIPPRRRKPAAAKGTQKTYVVVGQALLEANRALGSIPNAGELVFGLRQRMREHQLDTKRHPREVPRDELRNGGLRRAGCAVVLCGPLTWPCMLWRCQLVRTCTASLQDLLWWHRLVDGSYERCEADMRALCDMAADDVLASDFRVEILRPAYYIAKDDKQKRVFLVIRGTRSFHDVRRRWGLGVPCYHGGHSRRCHTHAPCVQVLTDVAAASEDMLGGQAHRGMAHAARWFQEHVADHLIDAHAKRPGYKLFVAGHSLGAGIAALLAMMLQHRVPDIQAVCFAPPACVSSDLCERYASHITSVILDKDIVPRFSLAAARKLSAELRGVDWKALLKDEFNRDVAALQKRIDAYASSVEAVS